MNNEFRTGVYFCRHLNGQQEPMQVDELAGFIRDMPEVTVIWYPSDLRLDDPAQVISQIK